MAFIDFDDLKDRVIDLAHTGVAKSKQLAEVAKLKTSNMGEEDTIKRAYLELGKLYYAEKGMTPEGAYAAACEKITAARAAIEANNDRITEIRTVADIADAEVVSEVVEDAPAQEPAAPLAPEAPVVEEPKTEE